MEVLCTEGTAIYTRCDVARSTLIDNLVNKYKEAMDDWRSLIEGVMSQWMNFKPYRPYSWGLKLHILISFFQEEEPNEEETYQVITSLKKVSIFSACHNLGQWNIWDSIFQDINDAKEKTGKTLPEEVSIMFSNLVVGSLLILN